MTTSKELVILDTCGTAGGYGAVFAGGLGCENFFNNLTGDVAIRLDASEVDEVSQCRIELCFRFGIDETTVIVKSFKTKADGDGRWKTGNP